MGRFDDVWNGRLECGICKTSFPILSGVAVLVDDVRGYLLHHVKGVSKVVPDSQIPKVFLNDYRDVRDEMKAFAQEHIDEDLESDRVNALYVMTHYLRSGGKSDQDSWWKPFHGKSSPLIDQLICEHWDCGPFFEIAKKVEALAAASVEKDLSAIELGCGVGGLFSFLKKNLRFYLGVDNSFASIALARHLNLGTDYPSDLSIPGDLLMGPAVRPLALAVEQDARADFVVGELDSLPLEKGRADLTLALNAIDMLDDPAILPRAQFDLLQPGGHAIESCPYVWHQQVAKRLRHQLAKDPAAKEIKDSALAVEWLYQKAGFKIDWVKDHVPWLFFKQARQLEIYSVHILCAKK